MPRVPTPLLCAGLVVLTVAAFLPLWNNEFNDYDDPIYITQNRWVYRGLSGSGTAGPGRPLKAITGNRSPGFPSSSTPSFSQRLGRTARWCPPAALHVENLCWHLGSVLLLFSLVCRMTGARWRSLPGRRPVRRPPDARGIRGLGRRAQGRLERLLWRSDPVDLRLVREEADVGALRRGPGGLRRLPLLQADADDVALRAVAARLLALVPPTTRGRPSIPGWKWRASPSCRRGGMGPAAAGEGAVFLPGGLYRTAHYGDASKSRDRGFSCHAPHVRPGRQRLYGLRLVRGAQRLAFGARDPLPPSRPYLVGRGGRRRGNYLAGGDSGRAVASTPAALAPGRLAVVRRHAGAGHRPGPGRRRPMPTGLRTGPTSGCW